MEKEKANLITKKFFMLNSMLKMESDLQKENVIQETRVHPITYIRWRSGDSFPTFKDVEKIASIACNCNEVMRLKNLNKQICEMIKLIEDGKELEQG